MAGLSIAELKKRDNFKIFARMIMNSSPFVLDKSRKTEVVIGFTKTNEDKEFKKKISTLTNSKNFFDWIETLKVGRSLFIPIKGKKSVLLSAIWKSPVYGGTLATGTAKEDAQLKKLNNDIVNECKKQRVSFLTFKISGKNKRNVDVVGAVTTKGTPKSDFMLVDAQGTAVCWISHKDGNNAKSFQQWGGMTETKVKNNPEVKKFVKSIESEYPDKTMPPKITIGGKLANTNSKSSVGMLAIYGVGYGGVAGEQNVDVLLQGTVGIKKVGSYYILTATTHADYNGTIEKGSYAPTAMVRYASGRNNFNIKGGRFSISPLDSRKIKKWV
ncbi:MAG: hypothetical protein R8M45_04390 [Ghiorsea sp.]